MSSIRTANFYVFRNDEPFACPGEELKNLLQAGDIMVVQRGDDPKKFTISIDGNNLPDVTGVEDDDILCCTAVNNVTYQVTGAQFKALIVPPNPLQIIVPHVAECVGEDTYEVTTVATAIDGVPPYTREWYWEIFGRADSEIPVEGNGEDRDGNANNQPDKPYFARTSGSDCLVIFSRKSQKNAAHNYSTLDGFDWTFLETISGINVKGGKFWEGDYWACAAGPGGSGVHLISVDPDTGDFTRVYKNIAQIAAGAGATGDAEAMFSVDFNPVTGRVVFGGYRVIYTANYLSDPELTQIRRIPNSGFEYSRGIVCDPNTNEWWYGNNKGEIFYSSNDGDSWTKQSFKYANIAVESNELFVDHEWVYFSCVSSKLAGRFKRDNSGVVQTDSDWVYCNTNDKRNLIRTGHGKKYYAKGYYSDTWELVYDEVVTFPNTSLPIILHTPFMTGTWLTVCDDDVVVKNPLEPQTQGPTYSVQLTDEIKAIQCTEVVTDLVFDKDQVTVPVQFCAGEIQASISADKTLAARLEPIEITWEATGGSSYELYSALDDTTTVVGASGSMTLYGTSASGTNSYSIRVLNGSNDLLEEQTVEVDQLGAGRVWEYADNIPSGQTGKWGDNNSRQKFHNTDAEGNDQRLYWDTFRLATRRIRVGNDFFDLTLPRPNSVGSLASDPTNFGSIFSWPTGVYPPVIGTQIEIYEYPDS